MEESGVTDSGISLECRKAIDDVTINLPSLKPPVEKCETPTGNSTASSSRSSDVDNTKDDIERSNSSDTPPAYSAIAVDARSDFLLEADRSDKNPRRERRGRNCCLHAITVSILNFEDFVRRNRDIIFRMLLILFYVWNIVWLAVAAVKDWQRCLPLFAVVCTVALFKLYSLIKDCAGEEIMEGLKPHLRFPSSFKRYGKYIAFVGALVGLGFWIAFDTISRPHQIISLVGYFVFLFLLFLLSKSHGHVIWRPVLWGCSIQVCLGLLILRTSAGFAVFDNLGFLVQTFLTYVSKGCEFVFGVMYTDHFFAFGVLPIIIYFSAFISILYHLGAMQYLISKIAWLMQITLGTSATESMVAAGNIFVGQSESPLLIRPYIKDLTTSELHAVMTAGFGTVAGSVLGAYLGFGIKAVYVITACVMAAPCALAVSKLLYPETKISKFTSDGGLALEASGHRNIIEAAFVGASQAIPLVLNIVANLIAFISLLAAINGLLHWYGSLVGIENLSFEFLCSYIFMPFSYLMGVEWADCFKCAELIGTKIFLNEFIAYEKLSLLMDNKKSGVMPRVNGTTGELLWISDRSEAIITYALCGFANVGSLGISIGGLGAMCPERQGEMAKIVLRALIGGIFVSFLNACVAGFFYLPPDVDCSKIFSQPWETSEEDYIYRCCCSNLNTTDSNVTTSFEMCCNYTWPSTYSSISGC